MRQGAFPETVIVSQGVFGKAGMERAHAHTQAQTRAPAHCFFVFHASCSSIDEVVVIKALF